jgi:hypothetical protein
VSSRRSDRQAAWNTFLLLTLLFLGILVLAVVRFKHGHISGGWQALGFALVELALILAFALPSQCRVTTTRRAPCRNDSFGLLLGCFHQRSHTFTKLLVRLRLKSEMRSESSPRATLAPSGSKPARTVDSNYETVKVSIESSVFDRCAAWVDMASSLLGIISFVVAVLTHGH